MNGYQTVFDAPHLQKRVHARDLAKYTCPDPPLEFYDLNGEAQSILLRYVSETYKPAPRACSHDSYGLKHVFERTGHDGDGPGFYITNATFKGAMLLAGFVPANPNERNWYFKIQAAKPCAGRLKQTPYGSYPCPKKPHLTTGLCSYHASRKARHLPIDATEYPDRESWLAAMDARRGVK